MRSHGKESADKGGTVAGNSTRNPRMDVIQGSTGGGEGRGDTTRELQSLEYQPKGFGVYFVVSDELQAEEPVISSGF